MPSARASALSRTYSPGWAPAPVGEIDAPELLACLRRVLARGTVETAYRIKDACGQVLRYAIASGLATRNPAADLREALPPVPTRHHAAIIRPWAMWAAGAAVVGTLFARLIAWVSTSKDNNGPTPGLSGCDLPPAGRC